MCTDNLVTEVEKPGYNKPESGVSVSDVDRGTDDGGDGKLYVVKSRMRVASSYVEGMTEAAAALGVRPCLDSAGAFELLAMDPHNNHRRKKSPTLMVEDERRVA